MPNNRTSGIPLTSLERELVALWRREVPAFVSEVERIPESVCRYNPFRAR